MDSLDLAPYLQVISPQRISLFHNLKLNSSKGSLPLQQRLSQIDSNTSFCDGTDKDECLEYLNKELQVLGFDGINCPDGSFNLPALINATYGILQKYRRARKHQDDLESRAHRTSTDLEHLQLTHRRLKAVNDNLQNEVARGEELLRQAKLENSNQKSKIKGLSDEIKKLKSQLLCNETQYKHDLRKKDRQLSVLKEKTQQILMEKTKVGHSSSLDMSKCLQQVDGKRSKWRNESTSNRNEEDLYGRVVASYERRCMGLQSENSRMRELLSDTQSELGAILNMGSCHPVSPNKSPKKDAVQLPIDIIQGRLTEAINSCCVKIRELVSPGRLDSQDLNTTYVLDEPTISSPDQSSPRRNSNRRTATPQSTRPSRSSENMELMLLKDQEHVSKERASLYKQRAELEEEKHRLVEATLSLKREQKMISDMRKQSHTLDTCAQEESDRCPDRSQLARHVEQVKNAVKEREQTKSEHK